MLYLIDAYNWLLSSSKEEFISENQLQKWIDQKTKILRDCRLQAILIFDAANSQQPLCRYSINSVEIIFTPSGQTADELILEMISSLPRSFAHVVTSDRHLGKSCRALGAQTSQIKTFLRKIDITPKKNSSRAGPSRYSQIKTDEDSENARAWVSRAEIAHFQHIFEMRYRRLNCSTDVDGSEAGD